MRVLILASRDSRHPEAAGGDNLLSQLALQLAEAGCAVTLVSAGHPSLAKREDRPGLTIRRWAVSRLLFPVVWARLLTDYHGRFDVVIEEAVGGERAPFLARILSGSPVVTFWYQDNRPLFATAYGRTGAAVAGGLQQFLLRLYRSSYAMTCSKATSAWLASEGFSSVRVTEVYPRVPIAGPSGDPVPFDRRSNRLVVIGNFRATKRFEEALDVLDRVRSSVPDAELVMAGRPQDPAYLAELRRRVEESRSRDSIQLRLSVSEPEKGEILRRAKVLTIHSRIEGFAWTIPEAGLWGVPTVGNSGVPTDTLRDGENGFRLAVGDVGAYVTTIVRLFTDRANWETLSEGARRVSREFAEGPIAPAALELLRRAARGFGTPIAPSAIDVSAIESR